MANLFSAKETGEILGLTNPKKASQAMGPAWEKVARHFRIDMARTLRTILQRADELPPMTEREQRVLRAVLDEQFNLGAPGPAPQGQRWNAAVMKGRTSKV